MALEMKKDSRWWYAKVSHKNKTRQYPLTDLVDGVETRIPIEGRRPSSLRLLEEGDRVFLHSHARAKAAHDRLVQSIRDGEAAEDLGNRLIETATGERREAVSLDDMPRRWTELPRKKKLSESHRASGMRVLKRLADFVRSRNDQCQTMQDVSAGQVQAYMRTLDRDGLSARTWNFNLGILKHAFKELTPHAPANRGYLEKAKRRTEDTVHREPFTDQELEKVLAAARKDDVLRGPVILSAYSGLRRGDACTLKSDAVDFEAGFLRVPTHKSGELARIPILDPLMEELKRHDLSGEFVFPEAAALYLETNKGEIQTRFNRILREAGFDVGRSKRSPLVRADLPTFSREDTDAAVEEALNQSDYQARKIELMREVYLEYASGLSVKKVAKELQISPSTVSIHLNSLEGLTGYAILRGGKRGAQTNMPEVRKDVKEGRSKRANLKGWHSLRTNFVTRALIAGMPEELLRKITGQATVEVVRKHYLNPDEETIAREFQKVQEAFKFESADSRDTGGGVPSVVERLELLKDRIGGVKPTELEESRGELVQELDLLIGDLGNGR